MLRPIARRHPFALSTFKIEPIACLKDNYAYLVSSAGLCAAVDPSEPEPVEAALASRGLRLTHILNTHHHWDHTGGNAALKKAYGAVVVGPAKDRERIPYHRAIWHGFVLVAAALQFSSIWGEFAR